MSFKSLVLALVILFSSNVFASSHTYTAMFTCEFPGGGTNQGHMSLCMESLKLTNFGKVAIHDWQSFSQINSPWEGGLKLSERFSIRTQNMDDWLIFRLVIRDRSGNVVFEDVAAKWGVLGVKN